MFSMDTKAVIILVKLAIEAFSSASFSYRTSPLSRLYKIALLDDISSSRALACTVNNINMKMKLNTFFIVTSDIIIPY